MYIPLIVYSSPFHTDLNFPPLYRKQASSKGRNWLRYRGPMLRKSQMWYFTELTLKKFLPIAACLSDNLERDHLVQVEFVR